VQGTPAVGADNNVHVSQVSASYTDHDVPLGTRRKDPRCADHGPAVSPELFTDEGGRCVMKRPSAQHGPSQYPGRADEFWAACARSWLRTVASSQHRALRPYITPPSTNLTVLAEWCLLGCYGV
jgi:hypothetical protein